MSEDISLSAKIRALRRVGTFRPVLTAGIIGLSVFAAVLEGIGLSFLLPIIDLAQGTRTCTDATGVLGGFCSVYQFVGVELTLKTAVIGVTVVMTVRYTSSFLVEWLKVLLRTRYVRFLQISAFDSALDAEIAYFDAEGSDDILNAIVTQATYAGLVIDRVVRIIQQVMLAAMYGVVALAMAPILTLASVALLGVFTVVSRTILESGYSVGDRVADANERIQEAAQAGTQGIRDVKLFGLDTELFEQFTRAADRFTASTIKLRRNQAALDNFYQLTTAITVFVLIFVALEVVGVPFRRLGVFLFAMFRLAPRASTLNNLVYKLEGELPHLVRTQAFIDELRAKTEPPGGDDPVPDRIERVSFEEVSFSYEGGERVLDGLSFDVERGEFVAFVGPSGAGKSTIVSLLARLYEPDGGRIEADGTPIDRFPTAEWRSRVSVVRQDPHVFNDTLRQNVNIGNRNATEEEIEHACEIARVTEFLDELPAGYESVLGDDGVRLSGGQRQRVAIARALLKDADLLVLDEATSDLDTGLEEEVHGNVESMDRDYAVLVVAHRLSTVTNADRIYTMEDGRVTEVGTHQELLESDGTYAELYTMQRTP